jgi:hypothetical protein
MRVSALGNSLESIAVLLCRDQEVRSLDFVLIRGEIENDTIPSSRMNTEINEESNMQTA